MGAVGYRFRAELRTTGRQLLVTAIVLGLAGGLALAAIAGARRTMSALPRLLDETSYGDVLVNPDLGAESALDPADVLALPGVDEGTYVAGIAALPTDASGAAPDVEAETFQLFVLDDAARDRPLITEGRAPHADAPDEIILSPDVAADLGVGVGDTVDQFVVDMPTFFACPDPEACPAAFELVSLRVVGLGRLPDEIADPAVEEGRAVASAAFLGEHPGAVAYWALLLHLDGSTPVEDVRAAVAALVPDEAVAFETTAGQVDRFQRSVRPQAIAMAAFGVVVGAAALLFACLALVRLAAALGADRRLVVSIGAEPRLVSVLGAAHGLASAAAGALVAVVVAAALSPLAPIGLARPADPDPGVALDLAVLGAGVLVSVLVLVVVAAASTHRTLRPGAGRRPARTSSGARALANVGAGPAMVLGARSALERGTGQHAVPARSTIATVAVALAGVIAAVTFGASLTHLLGTPSAHGINWDVRLDLDLPDTEDLSDVEAAAAVESRQEEAIAVLLARPDVEDLSVLTFSGVGLAGDDVPAMGLDLRAGSAHPTLVEGRAAGDRRTRWCSPRRRFAEPARASASRCASATGTWRWSAPRSSPATPSTPARTPPISARARGSPSRAWSRRARCSPVGRSSSASRLGSTPGRRSTATPRTGSCSPRRTSPSTPSGPRRWSTSSGSGRRRC